MMVAEYSGLEKLKNFSKQFGMEPLFAQVICIADDQAIHLFMFRVGHMEQILPKVKNGLSIRFGDKRIDELIRNCDYSSWKNERIGTYDFG